MSDKKVYSLGGTSVIPLIEPNEKADKGEVDWFQEALIQRQKRERDFLKETGKKRESPESTGFGRYLRACRLNRNLERADLARRTGIPAGRILALEKGIILPEDINPQWLCNLSEVLEVDIADFYTILGIPIELHRKFQQSLKELTVEVERLREKERHNAEEMEKLERRLEEAGQGLDFRTLVGFGFSAAALLFAHRFRGREQISEQERAVYNETHSSEAEVLELV